MMIKIINGMTMMCQTCQTTFEYEQQDLIPIPTYPCMSFVMCPKCGQQIIMVADGYKEANKRIIVESENEDIKETS